MKRLVCLISWLVCPFVCLFVSCGYSNIQTRPNWGKATVMTNTIFISTGSYQSPPSVYRLVVLSYFLQTPESLSVLYIKG
jgi:hypothetical protein